jgi:hypothetical protein
MPGTAEEWNALRNDQYSERRLPRFVDNTAGTAVKVDEVNHPPHYNNGKVECIEAIEASMSPQEYRGYLKGNALKYLWRYNYKGKPQQDLNKAQWYLNKLLEVMKSPS